MDIDPKVRKLERRKRIISTRMVFIHLLLILLFLLLLIPADVIDIPNIFGAALSKVRILGAFAPVFDHALPDTVINQTDIYIFDVNCSDADPLDQISYVDNFSGFDIDALSGLINQSGFSQAYVGNNTIAISCYDLFNHNTTDTFLFTVLDVNEPPVLGSIGDQILTEGEAFILDLDASDPENDTLTFGAVTSLFTIDPVTGYLNYTPAFAHIGNHTINFTVYDGGLYDHEVVLFTIVRGQFCGDELCGSAENCILCEGDCGACPQSPGGDSGESSEESEESTSTSEQQTTGEIPPQTALAPQPPQYRCDEKWECTPWSECTIQGTHTRKCKDINHCGSLKEKPKEAEECEYQPTCNDGVQNGGETGVDCGGPCESCPIDTCFDGIQNLGEAGIDCGGPCTKSCEIVAQARVPALEIPGILEIPRTFPWLFMLLIAILLSIALISDYAYVRRISKKGLDEYNQKRRAYTPWRRRLYKTLINLIAVSLITSAYLYYFSNEPGEMRRYLWALVLVLLAVPSTVSVILRRLRYYEYEKIKKEQRFKQTHRKQLLQLIKAENGFLGDLEAQSNAEMYDSVRQKSFDGSPAIYTLFRPLYSHTTSLIKKRKERLSLLVLSADLQERLTFFLSDRIAGHYAKDYPEFDLLLRILRRLKENKEADMTDKEQELMDEIEEISKPHLKAVVMADPDLVGVYNKLVELYDAYGERQRMLKGVDKEISDIERKFSDQVKEFSKKSDQMLVISKDPSFATLYNNFIRLFNHYSKKQQLRKAIEGL